MYSQCPSCKARFRVTATTLRAARGRARCGRCGEPFDVLENLSDEKPGPSTSTATRGSGARQPAPPPMRADDDDPEADHSNRFVL